MVASGYAVYMAEQKEQEVRKMKNKSLGFSIAGSFIIILFMLFINYTTSPGFPWFIYPVFAVLWWPIGVYTYQRGGVKFITIIGSLLIILFFIIVNLTTSPEFKWCIFPIYAVLWWPIGVFLGKKPKLMSIIGAVLTIGFFLTVNIMTGFSHPWFVYPAFAVLWWPVSVLIGKGHAKLFSTLGFLLISGFILTVNLVTSPSHLWFVHVIYLVLWWPLSVFLAKRKTIKIYSLTASLLSILYFAIINLLLTPDVFWFLYIVFPLILWPVLMYTEKEAGSLSVAIMGCITGISYYTILNVFMSPGHPWVLYLILPLVWWPVAIMFKKIAKNILFLFISLTIFIAYYSILNVFVSPGYPWSLYLIYPYAWAVLGMYFGTRHKAFALSVAATIVTAIFVSIMNIVLTPNTIWAVFPIFAILWWPMSIYFFKVRKNKDNT